MNKTGVFFGVVIVFLFALFAISAYVQATTPYEVTITTEFKTMIFWYVTVPCFATLALLVGVFLYEQKNNEGGDNKDGE